jgi:hypothetical protein
MSDLIIEVVAGPMDGLLCELANGATIGRSVGNALSISFDNMVSRRHVQFVKEGAYWCIKDLNSVNGTYYRKQRLKVNLSTPVEINEPVLVGATVIRLAQGQPKKESSVITKALLQDPRDVYEMAAPVLDVWDRLYQNMPEQGRYCDVELFFKELAAVTGPQAGARDMERILSPVGFGIWSSWLPSMFPFVPEYNLISNCLIIAPRLWQILKIASRIAGGQPLAPKDMVAAVRQEGRSLTAQFIDSDTSVRRVLDQVKMPATISGHAQKQDRCQNNIRRPDGIRKKKLDTPGSEPKTTASKQVQIAAERLRFGLNVEKLIHGFITDAKIVSPGQGSCLLPGFDKNLMEIAKSGDVSLERQYLETMYHCLAAILAAQQDGYDLYGRQICRRLEDSMDDTKDYKGGINFGAKKLKGRQKTVNVIHSTLARLESEGLGVEIVRAKIRENINSFSRTGTSKRRKSD